MPNLEAYDCEICLARYPQLARGRKGASLSHCLLMNTTSLSICGNDHLPVHRKAEEMHLYEQVFFSLVLF